MKGDVVSTIRMVANLVLMNIRNRYLGSTLGVFWAVVHPLLILGMYAFVFGFIYRTRLPGVGGLNSNYVVWFTSGFVPYFCIIDSLTTASNSIVANGALVKGTRFNSELLAIAGAFTGAIPWMVGTLFLLILSVVTGVVPTWRALLVIPIGVVAFLFLCGLGFFLSATTVFIRDLIYVLSLITTAIAFTTPIFYDISMMPAVAQKLTFFNPFYQIVSWYRAALLDQTPPSFLGAAYLFVLAAILCVAGLKYFRRLKGSFEMAL